MKPGEAKVAKSFADDRSMMKWLTGDGVEALKREYPPEQYSAKIDMVSREVKVERR